MFIYVKIKEMEYFGMVSVKVPTIYFLTSAKQEGKILWQL